MLAPDMSSCLPRRKHPVHMPPVKRHNDPIIVFVTIGIQPRVPALSNVRFMSAFRLACSDADAWSVGRFVIMPDHVHLFCSPAKWPPVSIKRWIGYLKERITKRLKKRLGAASPSMILEPARVLEGEPAVSRYRWKWQSDCWDTQIRSQEHYHQKWEYVRQNPVRKGLVNRVEDWPWQGEMNILRW